MESVSNSSNSKYAPLKCFIVSLGSSSRPGECAPAVRPRFSERGWPVYRFKVRLKLCSCLLRLSIECGYRGNKSTSVSSRALSCTSSSATSQVSSSRTSSSASPKKKCKPKGSSNDDDVNSNSSSHNTVVVSDNEGSK
ncbi:hypothetical protein EVAR_67203_1 [Eumeta japonica]|uniref:Uncharacterized protein n=1 Tax=Eumeta variegata TaxID=151549 RepID=A0A4C2A7E9_EUMVA|nr:hypothetical protein EVAR_67203_1 [Eumeta japonica]